MLDRLYAWVARFEDVLAFQALRRGLILTIPILLAGSFSLVFLNLPIGAYQDILSASPWLERILAIVYAATMGMFSLYVSVSVGFCYASSYAARYGSFFVPGAPLVALVSYLMLVGFGMDGFDVAILSTRSLFVAIVCGLVSSMLYCRFVSLRQEKRRYVDSIDGLFSQVAAALVPIVAVLVLFAIIQAVVMSLFGGAGVGDISSDAIDGLSSVIMATLGGGLLYLFMSNIMWFFGIHGGNMLDGVAQSVFASGTAANAASMAAGGEPVQIVTKTFLDVFASLGGAGALLSLLIAILLFGKRPNIRRLSVFAAVPMAFNVSEILLFGLPVVLNPILLVPFIVVPLVNAIVAYVAMATGLVPPTIVDVSWTTPPLMGGFIATGSFAGAALQLVNIVIGAVLYLPFLRRHEHLSEKHEHDEYANLLASFKEAELAQRIVNLIAAPGITGSVARSLADDIRQAVEDQSIELYYQPQFDVTGRAVGAEALLRFDHPTYGMVYPPLVVELAKEVGILDDLERVVFECALEGASHIEAQAHEGLVYSDFSVSVNATARMLQDEASIDFMLAAVRQHSLDPGRVVVEATEGEVLRWDEDASDRLRRLVDADIPLAIDDFSMGHTSLRYLETTLFSSVKLDGSLSKGVMDNDRFAEIVTSITRLSQRLGFTVLAEYVETTEQRDRLEALGCSYFQGYLYAPALPFDDMARRVRMRIAERLTPTDRDE